MKHPDELIEEPYLQALGYKPEFGPAYPGRIDGKSITHKIVPVELSSADSIRWR